MECPRGSDFISLQLLCVQMSVSNAYSHIMRTDSVQHWLRKVSNDLVKILIVKLSKSERS
eukprot:228171-Hanusia_phi.AAC.6